MKNLTLVLPLRDVVVYPGMLRTVTVGRAESAAAVQRHLDESVPLVMVPQIDPDEEDVKGAQLSPMGVQGHVIRAARLPDGTMRILVEGGERVRIKGKLKIQDGATVIQADPVPPTKEDPISVGALAKQAANLFGEWLLNSGFTPPEQQILRTPSDDPGRLADQIAASIDLDHEDRVDLLAEPAAGRRLASVLEELIVAIAAQRIGTEVNEKVTKAMDASQREYHLKEQMKVLRQELGDAGPEAEADEFEKRIRELGLDADGEKEALRECDRLRRIHPDTAEYTILRTWLETVCDLPWKVATTDTTDLVRAQKVLDEDHHGLEKVKERLVEYLAVRQLKPDHKGAILCLLGPPGVGKTSLGKSIARALGRNFGRIALGGIKDETEIRGHRRTYVGALPGRIVRAMIRAKSRNPVLVLDEIDKLGNDFRGDPASALLEVLDPEQNSTFTDHYLDLQFDLSQVLFLCTANVIDTVPPALADRLEIIEIPGYTSEDKQTIAREFLLPRLAEQHGLDADKIQIEPDALRTIIHEYTREAGLRDFERQLAAVHRKVARQVVEGRGKRVKIGANALARYLGPPKFHQELSERSDQPGVAIGLAWTAAGGDILFVEATKMPGKLSLKLTGSLGAVMKESVEAAMSWLRGHAAEIGVGPEAFESEFHLHVPAGAIPKDGPSAGVTMVTALASLVSGRPIKAHLAMTGEITLRGKVLPVGGIKEKVLAARHAGVRTVIMPRHNEKDLEDIPEVLRRDVTFVFVDTVSDVLEHALVKA